MRHGWGWASVLWLMLAPAGVGAESSGKRAASSGLAAARKAMAEAEFEAALQLLDRELGRTRGREERAAVQLLRAQCLTAMREPARAGEALEAALELDPETSLDESRASPEVVELLLQARERLAGELTILGNRPGIEIRLDGRVLGPAPLRLQVPVGQRTVEAVLDGQVKSKTLVLPVRARKTLEFEFGAPPPAVVSAPPVGGRRESKLAPALLAGGGGLLMVGGVWGTLRARATHRAFEAQQAEGAPLTVTRTEAARAKSLQVLSYGLLGVGGGFLAWGVVGLVRPPAEDEARWGLLPAPDGGALVYSGGF